MMKVIVFGGTGWLGHNIVLELAEHGFDVTVCSRGRKNTFAESVSSVKRISADKSDEASVKDIFSVRYDAVIDTVPTLESIALIVKYAKGLRHYIHCSSTGGYAPLPFIPCDETAPYGGFENATGWSQKAEVDSEVMRLFHTTGFPATVIRPSYITGPGMLPMDNLGGRRVDYIRDILEEKTIDVPDNGLALLHPVHVKDLATSFRLALKTHSAIGQIYNICLSHAVTLSRYHEITASVLGRTLRMNYMPTNEMQKKYEGSINAVGLRFLATHMCFSIEKAVRELGYRPHCSPEEAIEETAIWAAGKQ